MYRSFIPLRIPSSFRFAAHVLGALFIVQFGIASEQQNELRITADDFHGTLDGGAVISGNVSLQHGELELAADEVRIVMDGNSFKELQAKGEPAQCRFEILEEGNNRTVVAQATTINVQLDNRWIEFKGNARVESDDITIEGDVIRFDIDKKELEAESGDSGKQIEILMRDLDTATTEESAE